MKQNPTIPSYINQRMNGYVNRDYKNNTPSGTIGIDGDYTPINPKHSAKKTNRNTFNVPSAITYKGAIVQDGEIGITPASRVNAVENIIGIKKTSRLYPSTNGQNTHEVITW